MRAISTSFFDDGIETEVWNALFAFRTLVNMSAIGSVMLIFGMPPMVLSYILRAGWFAHARGARACPSAGPPRSAVLLACYQLALRTPGTSPLFASSRRHMRQSPN